jgi:hypothetical protein
MVLWWVRCAVPSSHLFRSASRSLAPELCDAKGGSPEQSPGPRLGLPIPGSLAPCPCGGQAFKRALPVFQTVFPDCPRCRFVRAFEPSTSQSALPCSNMEGSGSRRAWGASPNKGARADPLAVRGDQDGHLLSSFRLGQVRRHGRGQQGIVGQVSQLLECSFR